MDASRQRSRRYRLERYLTEGGMGAIYIGKKLGPGGFEKEVVLKQLLPEYTSRPEFRDLFFREAKISATLDHANIVHTFDLVESSESLFIVMELVRGADLRTIGRRAKMRGRQLSAAALIQVTLEVLAGLAYAHGRKDASGAPLGIIHRDLSPSNIMCSVQGEVKLSDFGIAKASTHSSVFYRVRGKVGYMSPEQARSEPIDGRSDLFSLAVCLWEALAGERLFPGDMNTPVDQLYSRPIPPIASRRPGFPPALDAFLARALALTPESRFQDAVSMAGALRKEAHQHGLIFSAPELAEHLKDVLGEEPFEWLKTEDSAGHAATDRPARELPSLEGEEASSIGIVDIELEPSLSYDLQEAEPDDGSSAEGMPSAEDLATIARLSLGGDPRRGVVIDEVDDEAPTGSIDVSGGPVQPPAPLSLQMTPTPLPPAAPLGGPAPFRATPVHSTPVRGMPARPAPVPVDPRKRLMNRILALGLAAAAGAGVAFLATARDDRPLEALHGTTPLAEGEQPVSIWVDDSAPPVSPPQPAPGSRTARVPAAEPDRTPAPSAPPRSKTRHRAPSRRHPARHPARHH